MNCKKNIFFGLLILFFATSLSAQLRDYIPMVRPVYGREMRDFFRSLSQTMNRNGYEEIGSMLASYAEGGYGSGFIYVARDGANYVVTNYHVIAGAESVTLEFERQDGTIIVYQNCPVYAVDKERDLALVSFQQNKRPFTYGLSLSDAHIMDGREVWTAGYPALLGKPMWQLGKGNITNSTARVPELVDPKITSLIQHSAQVDPGNSGGPLLVADRNSPGDFRVIGINTWKAVGRQAVNFSIPAGCVKEFIHASLETRSEDREIKPVTSLEQTCRDFAASFGAAAKSYRNIMKYISAEYVLKHGERILIRVLAYASESIRDEILSAFYNSGPLEAVQMVLAYYVFTAVREKKSQNNMEFVKIDAAAGAEQMNAWFSLGKQEFSTTWVYEYGKWSLSAFSLEAALIPSGNIDEVPYNSLLMLGSRLYFDNLTEPAWYLGFYYSINNYMSLGTELGLRFITADDGMGSEIDTTTFHMAMVCNFHFPVYVSDFSIIPYVSAGLDFNFNQRLLDYSGFIAEIGGGIQFGFSKEPFLVLGCAYLYGFEVFGIGEPHYEKSWLSIYLAVGI
jgi:S1-C subfamily serine protease